VSPRASNHGLAREDGFSVIEVLVAMVILTVAALAIATLSSSASHNTFRAEQDQVVVNRLQNELERIRQLPFSQVALTTKPASSNQAGNPAERVSSDGTQFDLNRDGTGTKPLAYSGGATPDGKPMSCGGTGQPVCGVNPGPEPFQSGDVSGKIYRYIAYPGVPPNCPGCSADYFKRIIVIIQLDTTPAGGAHVYQEIQSSVSSPDAVPSNNPVPPCDPSTNDCSDQQIATFWLTDTPCDSSTRVAPTADHDTHNTRGDCPDQVQTGTMRGAPDFMSTDPLSGSGSDPTYNYSTDVARTETPKLGLTMLKPQTATAAGCALQVVSNALNQTLDLPPAETNSQVEMHTWLSNPLATTFAPLTSADATLELWTKSVAGAAYQGDLCVYVFKRITVQQQLPGNITNTFVVDSPAIIGIHPYLEIQRATWPQTWTKVSTGDFHLNMVSVDSVLSALTQSGVPGTLTSPSQRLGLALTVNKDRTSGDALDVMYDQSTFDSRLEFDTTKGTCIVVTPCP
jgi:prepilin-type N-terminal cleavage/methylation domain-containing protein